MKHVWSYETHWCRRRTYPISCAIITRQLWFVATFKMPALQIEGTGSYWQSFMCWHLYFHVAKEPTPSAKRWNRLYLNLSPFQLLHPSPFGPLSLLLVLSKAASVRPSMQAWTCPLPNLHIKDREKGQPNNTLTIIDRSGGWRSRMRVGKVSDLDKHRTAMKMKLSKYVDWEGRVRSLLWKSGCADGAADGIWCCMIITDSWIN